MEIIPNTLKHGHKLLVHFENNFIIVGVLKKNCCDFRSVTDVTVDRVLITRLKVRHYYVRLSGRLAKRTIKHVTCYVMFHKTCTVICNSATGTFFFTHDCAFVVNFGSN